MIKTNKANYLFLDYVRKYVPWHLFVGAPKFPEYPMFKPDSSYGETSKMEILYNSSGNIYKITGENNSQEKVSIEFSYDDNTKKAKAELKKGSKVELTMREWLSNDEVILDIKYANDSDLDSEIRCILDSGKEYNME